MTTKIKPIYPWMGGKQRLMYRYREIVDFPKDFSLYVEPFFGAGSMFCEMRNSGYDGPSIINDLNLYVADLQTAVKEDSNNEVLKVFKELDDKKRSIDGYENRKSFFREIRDRVHKIDRDAEPGEYYGRFIFCLINRYNGRLSTDSDGRLNMSAGRNLHPERSRNKHFIQRDDFYDAYRKILQNTEIYNKNYSDLEFDPDGAFIFLDPPYRNTSGYRGNDWSDAETEELVRYAIDLQERGALVWIANKDYDDNFFEDLLSDVDCNIHKIDVVHQPNGGKGTAVTELLITLNQ